MANISITYMQFCECCIAHFREHNDRLPERMVIQIQNDAEVASVVEGALEMLQKDERIQDLFLLTLSPVTYAKAMQQLDRFANQMFYSQAAFQVRPSGGAPNPEPAPALVNDPEIGGGRG